MIRVQVNTKTHAYEALIENGLLRSAGPYLRDLLPGSSRFVVVTVPRVRKLYGRILAASLDDAGLQHSFLEMPDGEQFKTLATVETLGMKLAKLGADRESVVIALGGGIAGDVTGFLGSIYMRGIKVVQIPTTFLAQVDASVGGKTGVDMASGKNLLGTFKQPEVVLMDPSVLTTLPEREYRSGLFEAVKTGIIYNARIFDFMEANRDKILARDAGTLEWLIAEAVRVKAKVVSQDEKEKGLRMILNFGHTIGHALETETHYRKYLHGEAVAWGMIAATSIARRLKLLDAAAAERIVAVVNSYGPFPPVKVETAKVLARLNRDKKTVHGKVRFILPTSVGEVVVRDDVPNRVIVQAVEELNRISAPAKKSAKAKAR